jgi:hypothetical protein
VNPPQLAASTSVNASDGFEIASEGELPSNDDKDKDNNGDASNSLNLQQEDQISAPQPKHDSSSQNNNALE